MGFKRIMTTPVGLWSTFTEIQKDGIKIGAAYRQVYQEEIKNFCLSA